MKLLSRWYKRSKNFINQPSPIDIYFEYHHQFLQLIHIWKLLVVKLGPMKLKSCPRFICLGEVMNFKGMTSPDNTLIKKIIKTCRNIHPTMPLEGHVPAYTGEDLTKVIYAGITTDHTQQTAELVEEKVRNGMFVEVQLKSMHQDVIDTIIKNDFFEHVALVTDDSMPDTLLHSHLNALVKESN